MKGTNLIHPLERDVKDILLTRKRQLTADSDSNSLLGVLTVVVGLSQSQIISTISSFPSDNQSNHT